jgi:hypothetical protein
MQVLLTQVVAVVVAVDQVEMLLRAVMVDQVF